MTFIFLRSLLKIACKNNYVSCVSLSICLSTQIGTFKGEQTYKLSENFLLSLSLHGNKLRVQKVTLYKFFTFSSLCSQDTAMEPSLHTVYLRCFFIIILIYA